MKASSPDRRRIARAVAGRRDAVLSGWLANHREPEDYRRTYLGPLLALLTGWIESGESAYAHVYRDERRRVFGTLARPEDYGEALGELLARDEAVVLDAIADPGERAAASALLDELHAPILAPAGESLRTLLVGDCLMTEIRAFLVPLLHEHGIATAPQHIYFSAGYGDAHAGDELAEIVRRDRPQLVGLSFFTFEGLPPFSALMAEADRLDASSARERVDQLVAIVAGYLERLRELTDAPVLVHGACGLPLTRYRKRIPVVPSLSRGRRRVLDGLNAGLAELVQHTENAILVDEPRLAAGAGLRRIGRPLFPDSLVRDALFHTSRLGEALAHEYVESARALALLGRTKVLLVDLDNTLWEGVMAEGEVVHDEGAQRLLGELRAAGILLVSVSKNDPGSIRWDELLLDKDDFVLHKVGWGQKAQSIAEAAQQLDLGLDSFVLIDDNPVERELVEQALPAVRTLDPLDPFTWRALRAMLEFPNTRRTEEAARRTEIYREASARRSALVEAPDYESQMATLELRADVRPATAADIERVHELLERTNQFNTTTIRRSRTEVRELIDDPGHAIYVGSLSDKFGDLGLVAVAVVARRDDGIAFDSFVMSCRAMGFGLEQLLIRTVLDREAAGRNATGRFVPSARNGPAARLYAQCGFSERGDGEWRLAAGEARPPVPPWFQKEAAPVP